MVRLSTRVETLKEVLQKYLDDDADMKDLNLSAKCAPRCGGRLRLDLWFAQGHATVPGGSVHASHMMSRCRRPSYQWRTQAVMLRICPCFWLTSTKRCVQAEVFGETAFCSRRFEEALQRANSLQRRSLDASMMSPATGPGELREPPSPMGYAMYKQSFFPRVCTHLCTASDRHRRLCSIVACLLMSFCLVASQHPVCHDCSSSCGRP